VREEQRVRVLQRLVDRLVPEELLVQEVLVRPRLLLPRADARKLEVDLVAEALRHDHLEIGNYFLHLLGSLRLRLDHFLKSVSVFRENGHHFRILNNHFVYSHFLTVRFLRVY
jgi:hypothetical protein